MSVSTREGRSRVSGSHASWRTHNLFREIHLSDVVHLTLIVQFGNWNKVGIIDLLEKWTLSWIYIFCAVQTLTMWAFITALSLCIYAGFYTFQKHVIVIFWSKSQLKRSLKTCREYQICGGLVWFGSGSGTLAIWRTHLHRCKERPTEIPTGGVFDWGFYGCFTSMKILQKYPKRSVGEMYTWFFCQIM